MWFRPKPDPQCFEKLIAQLRAEGQVAFAAQLDDMIHHTAWTTGTELNGELALAIRAFRRTRPKVSRDLHRLLRTCYHATRPPWP